MRGFLVKSFCFFLLLALPLCAGEIYVRSLPNPAKAKHEFLSQHSREVETLVLGSSHTYYGVSPEIIGKNAYNAAQVSQTYRYDHWVLTHYPFDRLKNVILPLSDFSFYESLEESGQWPYASRYRLYMNCDIHARLSVYDWEITAFRNYLEKLRSLWRPPRMKWSESGQGLEYTLKERPRQWENGTQRAARNRYESFDSNSRHGEPYLYLIANWCETLGVRLLIVSTPLRPDYRAAQSLEQLKDMECRLAKVLRRYPETIVYRDYTQDERFKEEDFYDSDHLSLQGAHRFTTLLLPDLK